MSNIKYKADLWYQSRPLESWNLDKRSAEEGYKAGYKEALEDAMVLESSQDYCNRVKEEQSNASWEDETVELCMTCIKQRE